MLKHFQCNSICIINSFYCAIHVVLSSFGKRFLSFLLGSLLLQTPLLLQTTSQPMYLFLWVLLFYYGLIAPIINKQQVDLSKYSVSQSLRLCNISAFGCPLSFHHHWSATSKMLCTGQWSYRDCLLTLCFEHQRQRLWHSVAKKSSTSFWLCVMYALP